jgi:hypothetical protein
MNGAVPVKETVSTAAVLGQTDCVPLMKVAVGFGLTVTVAVPPVNPVERTQPLASVTLTKLKPVVVAKTPVLKGTPLLTFVTVILLVPSL